MPLFLFAAVLVFHAAVVGTSKPAPSLTPERVSTLPVAERKPWLDYLAASDRQRAADKAALAAERVGLAAMPPPPKEGSSARSIPLNRDSAWYGSPEALALAGNIVSFQLPNGGWSKNLDMAAGARQKGQSWMPNNVSRYLGPDDFDQPADPGWNYAGTLDNDATTTELHYLAMVSARHSGHEGDALRAAYLRGVEYLLRAQFPNGGWPQVWPLEGGYHDAITFNDNAVTEAAGVLVEAAGAVSAVPSATRRRAAEAAQRAVQLVLRCQVVVDGKRTIWAQQHDALTLLPVAGRNFEPAALSAGESSDILLFLMRWKPQTPEIRASVEAGVGWLKSQAIYGEAWVGGRQPAQPRHLEAQPGAGPIWPRYTSIETGKPVFGDRDKSIHDKVDELTAERRNGYAWYSSGPREALDAYAAWRR